ncbi:MAG: type II toxin-antitoxin system VapC family toxin [Campylobacterales bacterium]
MTYLLDTNIISYIIKNRDFTLIDKFESISKKHTIGVSSITIAELYYGVKKKGRKS